MVFVYMFYIFFLFVLVHTVLLYHTLTSPIRVLCSDASLFQLPAAYN